MADPTDSTTSSTADPPLRAAVAPKQLLQAAEAMERLSHESLVAVASSRGLSVRELRLRLDQRLLDLAEGGDVEAIRMLSERTAGVALGRIERCRTAKSMHRRVLRALADGGIGVSEASKLAGLVRLKRELEHDDLDQRLAEVEGSLIDRVDG